MKGFKYTKKQLDFIYKNKALPRTDLAAAFNRKFRGKRTAGGMKQVCLRRGWHTGRTGCFEKGHKTWNKDTKGLTFVNVTSFKKGNRPHNWLPVGTEIIDSDGYIKVKLAEPNIWEFKHLLIWQAAHGKIPYGMPVIFKDNNKLNCTLENLELVSRHVLLYLNQNKYMKLPEELKPSMMALAKLECKAFALAK